MNDATPRIARLLTLLACLALAPAALAVATVKATAVGPKAGETMIRLFDSGGQPVRPDAGNPNSFSNLAPGSYSAETVVGGRVIGGRQSVRLADGENPLRVDSETGAITALPLLGRRQQQQQRGHSVVSLEYSRWNFDLRVCGNVPAQTCGDVDLDEFKPWLHYEYRAPLTRTTVGGTPVMPWWYGGISAPLDDDQQEITLEFHAPTPGLDSGGKLKVPFVLRGGVGATAQLGGGFSLEANAGLFGMRSEISAISTEVATRNEFTNRKTLFGADLGLRLNYGFTPHFQAGIGINGLCYGSQRASGTSALNFSYEAKRDSGCDSRYGAFLRGRF